MSKAPMKSPGSMSVGAVLAGIRRTPMLGIAAPPGGSCALEFSLGRALLQGASTPVPELWSRTTRDAEAAERVSEAFFGHFGRQPADPEQAIKWLERAAAQEARPPPMLAGRVACRGMGDRAPKDYAKAVAYFEQGARGGDLSSQFALGDIQYRGLGCEADPAKGVEGIAAPPTMATAAPMAMATIYGQGAAGEAADPNWQRIAAGLAADRRLGVLRAIRNGTSR